MTCDDYGAARVYPQEAVCTCRQNELGEFIEYLNYFFIKT